MSLEGHFRIAEMAADLGEHEGVYSLVLRVAVTTAEAGWRGWQRRWQARRGLLETGG
jgi:hypothetical protein